MDKNEVITLVKNYNAVLLEDEYNKAYMLDFLKRNEIVFGKSNKDGHITSSAWIINEKRDKVFLTHHAKLNKWIQLGGHTEEEDARLIDSALREVREESGLLSAKPVLDSIFDIDIHIYPARNGDKEHCHYDIRFLFQADDSEKYTVTNESKDLQWISLENLVLIKTDEAVIRMCNKTKEMFK